MRWTSKAFCACALSIILAGCGDDLDCASSGARELVAQIAKEHSAMIQTVQMVIERNLVQELTEKSETYCAEWVDKNPEIIRFPKGPYGVEEPHYCCGYVPPTPDARRRTRIDSCRDTFDQKALENLRKTKTVVDYSLDAIRTSAKDETTGAVACAANLHAVAAEKYNASAEEPITYKLEKTSDGKLYATVFGLSNTGLETRH